MKALALGFFITSVALGGTCIHLVNRVSEERERAEVERALRQDHESRLQQLDVQTREAAMDDDDFGSAYTTSAANAVMPAVAAGPDAGAEPAREIPRPLMRDRFNPYSTPQGREMMRVQSRVMSKRLYGDLLLQLNLGPQQTDAFLALLADQSARERETLAQLRGDRAARSQARSDLQAQANAEVASLLGASAAEQFAAYEATLGERLQVNRIAEQLDALNAPLQTEQKQQLITVMAEEKASFPEPEIENPRDPAAREARLDWQEDYNRRVLSRASSFLTSEQTRQITEIQDWQISLQRQAQARRARGARDR